MNIRIVKVSLRQKVALIVLGIFLTIVILEIGLRIGGGIFLSMREYGNWKSLQKKGAYCILCVGESTTFDDGGEKAYPRQLETVLNQKNLGITFSVVNKGASGKNSTYILEQIEKYLDTYKPDMVITMMGVNDDCDSLPYKGESSSYWGNFFHSLRVYKIFTLLQAHMRATIKRITIFTAKKYKNSPAVPTTDVQAGESNAHEASATSPQNAQITVDECYRQQREHVRSEKMLIEAVRHNPKKYEAYFELGLYYVDQANYSRAAEAFSKAIELDPVQREGYIQLGLAYMNLDQFALADEFFEKAVALRPQDSDIYTLWAWNAYVKQRYVRAEEILKRAIEHVPDCSYVFYTLGRLYHEEGKYIQAATMYQKAISLSLQSDKAYGGLVAVYNEIGKPELAKKYYEKINNLRMHYYNPVTKTNYLKLQNILDKRKITLVCVQYPLRNIEIVRRIFPKQEGIIFVDNEKIFKDAVNKGSYKDYFADMFAGDFGHCTRKGYRLLAENIAQQIMKGIFGK
jgi:tetratricopeptide (TPR) repeat protein